MLMRRGLLGLRAHPRGEQAAHRAEIQDGVEQAGPDALEAAEYRVLDRVPDVALLRHRIDQAKRSGAARVDGAAGQHQGHRLRRIDQIGKTRGAAEAGMQAEQHLGETEARIIDRDARLARQRDFEAAAKAEAVNHRNRRNPQTLEPVGHQMGLRHHGLDHAGIGRAAEFVDVGAGDEAGRLCRADHNAGRPLVFQRGQYQFEFAHHVGGKRVGAGAGAVEQ